MLAFWSGPDPAIVDRLFRASGLMREKWDCRRGSSTYGADTITAALAGRTEYWSASSPRSAVQKGVGSAHELVDGKPGDRGLDDVGNASRLVDRHGDRLRYVPAWRQWFHPGPDPDPETSTTEIETGDEPGAVTPPPEKVVRRFFGVKALEPLRVSRDADQIATEVVTHLVGLVGADVQVKIEITADVPEGVPDKVVRTITENAKTLKFEQHGFEES
jgi:hypothetical protein